MNNQNDNGVYTIDTSQFEDDNHAPDMVVRRTVTPDVSNVVIQPDITERSNGRIVFDTDTCYVEEPMGANIYRRSIVMTKDIFIKCYNEWILGDSDSIKNKVEDPWIRECQACKAEVK